MFLICNEDSGIQEIHAPYQRVSQRGFVYRFLDHLYENNLSTHSKLKNLFLIQFLATLQFLQIQCSLWISEHDLGIVHIQYLVI